MRNNQNHRHANTFVNIVIILEICKHLPQDCRKIVARFNQRKGLLPPLSRLSRHHGRANRGSSESRGEFARAMPSRDRGTRGQRAATPQVVQPKVLRLGDEYQGVLRGQHRGAHSRASSATPSTKIQQKFRA